MANDVRAIASHWAPNSGAAADVNAMRESGLHTPVALDDRTYGGRSFAKIVTRSPVRCAVIAAVKPSAPQPITATSRLPVAASRAFFTAMISSPPRQRPPASAVSKVVHHNLVADVLDVRPRPRGAKRPQANRRSEDPVDMRPYRNDRPHHIVKRQRRHPARRRSTPASPASGEAGQAQSGKRARLLQERPTIHGASPDVRRKGGTV